MKLLVAALLLFFNSFAYGAVDAVELAALQDLYNSTNGDRWTYSTNWLQGDPCDDNWYGLNCVNGHIDAILLQQNNLGGCTSIKFW